MPIFGDNTAGGDTFPGSGDRGLFGLFTLTEDGTATEIAVRFDATSSAGSSAKGVIYTSGGTLVHATTGQAVPAGGGLLTWALADIPLTAGSYYLGSVLSDFKGVWQCDVGTGQRVEGVTYASPASTMGTLNSTGAIPDVYVTYTAGAAPTAEQEGFRFGADDGSESAHTWKDAQDASITSPLGANLLLRALINGTGDYATAPFKLKYQKNGAGGYVDVPVGASVAEAYDTISFGAIGTGANGGTSVAPSYPTGITAGQYLTCHVSSGATNSETPSTPAGWTLLATGASTDGTYGIDTGPRRMTVFGKIADGTETGTLTVNITNGGTCRGSIIRWTKSGSGTWDVVGQGANDSTSGTGFSATTASINWNTGDATVVSVGQRVDSATQSAQSLTASGVTFGTRTNQATVAVTTGNDHRHVIDTFAAVTGTSNVNAAPTWAYTASASVSGGLVVVRLRAYTAPSNNEVYVATSANIAAGGEATTARLTPPSGKTTSSFTTGRRWEDENGADSVDIAADFYTELEWCLRAQSPAANGDFYDFRVYNNNAALDTYTVTPRWTIGADGAVITEPASADSSQTATNVTSAARTEAVTADATATVLDNSAAGTGATTADASQDASVTTSASRTEAVTAADESTYPAGSVVPTLIATTAAGATGSTGGSTSAIDTTGATQLRIIVASQVNTLTNGSLTDNKSNAFVIDSGPTQIGTFPGYAYVYRPSAAPAVGTGHIFTINGSGSFASQFVEAVGPSAGGTVSVGTVANVQDTSRPYLTGSITPAQDNALLLGWAGDDSTGGAVAWTWTSPSTILSGATINDHNSFWGGTIGQRTVNAAGSYTMEATNSGTGGQGVAIIHSYTEVTSGGGSQSASQTDSASADASQAADGAGAASRTEATTADSAQTAIRSTADTVTEGSGPSVGDEQNDYQLDGAGFSPQLVTVDSQNGQYMLVCVLGDSGTQQTPTDNKGNTGTISLIDSLNYFADQWAPYNMRVYGKAAIQGGAGHVVSVVKSSSPAAEATMLVVVANGLTLQDHSIARRQTQGAGGGNMVSDPVTTTGPALLVSFWSGDGGLGVANLDTEVLSGTGWTLLRMVAIEATAHIQHALAVKLVDAGTHTITWHNLGDQGCIIQLNALQGGGAADVYAALVGLGASDTAAASAAASHPATLTTSAADTASATATAAHPATSSTSAAGTEPATADTTQTGSNATATTRTESTTAADASDGTNTGGGVSVTEPGSPADTQAGITATAAAQTEATTGGDTVAAILATAAAITEAVSAGDLGAAIAVLLAVLTEPGSAADSSTASSSSAGSADTLEGVTATDSAAATQAGGAGITEGTTAAANQLATGLSSAAVSEPTTPGDTSLPAREAFAADTATASPGDTQAGTVLGGVAGMIEATTATDALVALKAAVATILEAVTLTDDQRSSFTVASITEGATAADFIAWIRDIGPTSPRVLTIEAENRVLTIAAEDRKLVIVAENRTLVIDAENRTITVQGG